MLREVDLPVMLIVDLNLARVVQYSPFQFHAFAYAVQVISVLDRVVIQIACMCMHMTTIILRVQKFNSLLTEMITPQTYNNIIYI